MSGLSKALRLAVLVTAISGCAVTSSQSEVGGSANAGQDSVTTNPNTIAAGGVAGEGLALGGDKPTTVEQILLGGSPGEFAVKVNRGVDISRFSLSTESDAVRFTVKNEEKSNRLVVDLVGQPAKGSKAVAVENDAFVKGVRVGGTAFKTRVVFDLASTGATRSEVKKEGENVVVSFFNKEGESARSSNTSLPEATEVAGSVSTDSQSKAATSPAAVQLTEMRFAKSAQSPSGEVTLALSEQVPFHLKRAAQSEYVLTLPGVVATEKTTAPLLSTSGSRGIRSARTVQEGDVAKVRMFVEPGVELVARTAGANIIVGVSEAAPALSSEARGQLQSEPKAGEEKSSSAGSPAAANDKLIGVASDDETARRNPTGVPSADGSKIYTGRLISLDLQETDIDNALRIIAEVSNLNIIASDDVAGKVTLRLIDVPWDQALDVILKTNGLDQVTEGNVIRIAPVDKLRQEREALREAKKAAENLEDLKVKYVRISYARAAEMKEQVEAVLSERGTVAIDERTNQLIVKDIQKGHDESNQLIRRLDLRTPQVLLETQIVEANTSFLRELGFQWNFSYVQSPETGNPTGLVFPNSIKNDFGFSKLGGTPETNFIGAVLNSADASRALTAKLQYEEKEGRAKIISRPQVATVNNKQAEIKSVQTIRVKLPDSGLSVATGQGASASGAGQTAFQEINVGIELKVTPQASPDYYVLMDIDAKSSTLGNLEVDGVPSTIDRRATSTILVKSGQTFALGGVYRIQDNNDIQGVPWMKDIPVLGHLFRYTKFDNRDEELIFFITPHIVEGSFDPSLM